jgi:hypothetical protein
LRTCNRRLLQDLLMSTKAFILDSFFLPQHSDIGYITVSRDGYYWNELFPGTGSSQSLWGILTADFYNDQSLPQASLSA